MYRSHTIIKVSDIYEISYIYIGDEVCKFVEKGGMMMYKKILLATDGSEYATRAAKYAIELAKSTQEASIEIIYVMDVNRGKVKSSEIKIRLQETEQMAKAARIHYEIIYLQGDPGPQIVKHANEYHFDIVVIGSRGLNRFQEFVLGSVSHKVAKRARCPVLIVK